MLYNISSGKRLNSIILWSNPGDLVLSTFSGVASEGTVTIEQGRRYLGIELKKFYFDRGVRNMRGAEELARQITLV